MPRRGGNARYWILGGLFFGILVALGYVSTSYMQGPVFGHRDYYTVLFQDVNGVRKEDKVMVHGSVYGRVSAIEPIAPEVWNQTGRDLVDEGMVGPDERFTPHALVVLELRYPIELRSSYRIWAADTTLLGGKAVMVMPGSVTDPPLTPPPPEDQGRFSAQSVDDLRKVRLVGRPRPHPLDAIGKLVEDHRGSFDAIVADIRRFTQGLNDTEAGGIAARLVHDKELGDRFDNIVARVEGFTELLDQEGSLLSDVVRPETELRTNTGQLLAKANGFMDRLDEPESVLGRLTRADSPWPGRVDSILDKADTIAEDARDFTQRLRAEESLVGKALAEGPDSLGAKVDGILDEVRHALQGVNENEDGLAWEFIHGDTGASARRVIGQIESVAAGIETHFIGPIRDKEGVVGLLLKDELTMARTERIVKTILGVIEDAREAAPVTSLGSFIFGGF